MEEKEIERLIDKKVAEAKLDVSEKIFRLVLYFGSAALALFGIAFPIWSVDKLTTKLENAIDKFDKTSQQTTQQFNQQSKESSIEQKLQYKELTEAQTKASDASSTKIDNAITEMRKEFKELAGAQLRKPNLECLFDGRTLQGATLRVSPKMRDFGIEIKNVGDAPTRNVQLKIYLKTDITDDNQFFGFPRSNCDEQSYNIAYEINVRPSSINGGYSTTVPIHIALDKVSNIPALLKVYQEEGDPKKYTFSIEYKD